jgi:hypothetical protein
MKRRHDLAGNEQTLPRPAPAHSGVPLVHQWHKTRADMITTLHVRSPLCNALFSKILGPALATFLSVFLS